LGDGARRGDCRHGDYAQRQAIVGFRHFAVSVSVPTNLVIARLDRAIQ
jgi:hypothetical protein